MDIRQRKYRAEVYAANVEYERTTTWNAPSAVLLSDEDHETGVHWMQCPDCNGTGFFPVPWTPDDTEDSIFCVMCKQQGLIPIMA